VQLATSGGQSWQLRLGGIAVVVKTFNNNTFLIAGLR
jgi:hypothetical protein